MLYSQIVTLSDLLDFIETLSEITASETQLTLEEYLRALLKIIQKHASEQTTCSLFGKILLDAFSEEPLPFDKHWLKYTHPPLPHNQILSFEYLHQTILYQIADLHRMKDVEISSIDKYAGFDSPTGNRWYNFHPADYLGCTAEGFRSHIKKSNNVYWSPIPHTFDSTKCGWDDLAEILNLGQNYE